MQGVNSREAHTFSRMSLVTRALGGYPGKSRRINIEDAANLESY